MSLNRKDMGVFQLGDGCMIIRESNDRCPRYPPVDLRVTAEDESEDLKIVIIGSVHFVSCTPQPGKRNGPLFTLGDCTERDPRDKN